MYDAQDAPRSMPIAGDIVIAKRAGSKSTYTLSVVPGPAQLRMRSYDRAMVMASRLAAVVRVDVWLDEGGGSWRVAEYRSASSGLLRSRYC
jgi:hypothetical protein